MKISQNDLSKIFIKNNFFISDFLGTGGIIKFYYLFLIVLLDICENVMSV